MHPMYTAGYLGGWTPATLRSEAAYLGALLLDIRLNPTSMRPAWQKQELVRLFGDAYRHLPELGNVNYRNGGPIQLARPERAVEQVRTILQERPVILLCACANAQTCHRSVAATYLAERIGGMIVHLDPPAPVAVPGAIKALTLTQPWASLVAIGAKRIETRSWSTRYRGPLAIHAASGLGPVGGMRGLWDQCGREPFESVLRAAGFRNVEELPRGAVVAVADLVSVVTTEQALIGVRWDGPDGTQYDYRVSEQERAFGDYRPNRFAWLLDNVQALPRPVPAKGALGLWDWVVPDDDAGVFNA